MRVLVTNDDGIDGVGMQKLAIALAKDGRCDVRVVAPDGDRSGTGASLGVMGPTGLTARRVEFADDPTIEAWALDGTPAMCVLATVLGGFGEPPDLVVSGVNAGLNTGRSVLHSGTVGAALTAQNLRVSALAVSLQSGDPWHWDTATDLTLEVLDRLIDGPPRSVLNLNVPDRARSDVLGVRWAKLAPFGEVRMAVRGKDDESDAPGSTTRHLAAELQLAEVDFASDTDTGLVRAGYATLTTLVGLAEAWPEDRAPEAGVPEPPAIIERLIPGAPIHETHQVPDADLPGTLHRLRVINPR